MVGMARPYFADPDLPLKLLENRAAEIRPCVSCNEDCRAFDPCLLCTVNPSLAPPGDTRRPAKPYLVQGGVGGSVTGGGATGGGAMGGGAIDGGGRVAIVGAGPAGLECAWTLVQQGGTEVVLFEAGPELGGKMGVAARAPHRAGWQRLLDFYARALDAASVDLRLGVQAEASDLSGFGEVVIAVGSDELLPEVDGVAAALTVSDAIAAGPERLRGVESLVVVDDGFGWWPGVSAVELGIAAGVGRITMLTPGGSFAAGLPHESRFQLMQRLAGAPLATQSFLQPVSIGDGLLTAKHRFTGEPVTVPADLVIFVGERRPKPFAGDLPGNARVQAIGDAYLPRRVSHAIAEGRAAAETILTVKQLGVPS
jgi:2,4-dienoyl-CoA reductase (NADPH2)